MNTKQPHISPDKRTEEVLYLLPFKRKSSPTPINSHTNPETHNIYYSIHCLVLLN